MAFSECKQFKRILIANRGEIAVRIIRSIKQYGAEAHVIYSEPDRSSFHVQIADKAHALGGSQAQDSYLNIPKILSIIKKERIDAVHPGYGFLSENADFARTLEKLKVTLIGPSSQVMQTLGDKINAKAAAKKLKIPTLESVEITNAELKDKKLNAFLKKAALPLVIKAAGGGGGRGMRIVRKADQLVPSIQSARREAQAAFNNPSLFIEKYIERARHIEVQILGDKYGNVCHVFDRDCSLQRNYQKIIEEAPAPNIAPSIRKKILKSALTLCKDVKYSGAATVEFLLSADGKFYFLEVNTRLQVEHTVSEEISGLDLVELQIKLAAGEKLKELIPTELKARGHAIQCRICAESPENNFVPSSGKLIDFQFGDKQNDHHLRIDSGVRKGDIISSYYDSMLAKCVVHADNRRSAIRAMLDAIASSKLFGIFNNSGFLIELLKCAAFQNCSHHTKFIETHLKTLSWKDIYLQPAAAFYYWNMLQSKSPNHQFDIWNLPATSYPVTTQLLVNNYITINLRLEFRYNGKFLYSIEGSNALFEILNFERYEHGCRYNHESSEKRLTIIKGATGFWVSGEAGSILISQVESFTTNKADHRPKNSPYIIAALPGKISAVKVKIGQLVDKESELLCMESMKMEHVIKSSAPARVSAILVQENQTVTAGTKLIELEFL